MLNDEGSNNSEESFTLEVSANAVIEDGHLLVVPAGGDITLRVPFSAPAETPDIFGVVAKSTYQNPDDNLWYVRVVRNVKINLAYCQVLPIMTDAEYTTFLQRLQELKFTIGKESNSVISKGYPQATVRNGDDAHGQGITEPEVSY